MLKALLKKIARRSPHHAQRHASVVVKGGAVLAVGYNHSGRHSEVVALSKLWPSKRKGTTMINLRLKKSGVVGDSSPCEKCRAFLLKNGVVKVIVIEEEEC
jgi:deoxycytidylate deaminase